MSSSNDRKPTNAPQAYACNGGSCDISAHGEVHGSGISNGLSRRTLLRGVAVTAAGIALAGFQGNTFAQDTRAA